MSFIPFPKIPRWKNQHIVVTEKIDGTNAQIVINEDCTELRCGSRSRWITPEDDNFGFAKWAYDNKDKLLSLGKGQHFGEWWGEGIQRGYGLKEKRLSLFNTLRWSTPEQEERLNASPCSLVPVLYQGPFSDAAIEECIDELRVKGSRASPGFLDPEGLIIYFAGTRSIFKYPFDPAPKGKQ